MQLTGIATPCSPFRPLRRAIPEQDRRKIARPSSRPSYATEQGGELCYRSLTSTMMFAPPPACAKEPLLDRGRFSATFRSPCHAWPPRRYSWCTLESEGPQNHANFNSPSVRLRPPNRRPRSPVCPKLAFTQKAVVTQRQSAAVSPQRTKNAQAEDTPFTGG